MRHGLLISAAVIFALIGVGCSNGKLGRREAKRKLDAYYIANPLPFGDVEILFRTGTVSDYCFMDHVFSPLRPVSDERDYKLLTRLGLVTVEPEHATTAKVTLTEAGIKAATSGPYGHKVKTNCDSSQYGMLLTTFDKTEVTGIQQEGTNAKVQHLLCRKLTPLGKSVRDLRLSEEEVRLSPILGLDRLLANLGDRDWYCKIEDAHFAKYDDGWRVE